MAIQQFLEDEDGFEPIRQTTTTTTTTATQDAPVEDTGDVDDIGPIENRPTTPPPEPVKWTGTINTKEGFTVGVTINPYFATTYGPSGQPAEFKDKAGTSASGPIEILIDRDGVRYFTIDVVGPTYENNIIRGYNASGQQITFAMVPATGVGQPDTTATVTIGSATGQYIRKVRLEPDPRDYVAYKSIVLSSPEKVVDPPPPPPPPTTYPPAPSGSIALKDVVQFSTTGITRNYTKGTLKAIASETVYVKNTAPDIDVTVKLTGAGGVQFTPSTIDLPRNSQKSFVVSFDVAQVNNLPEGTNLVSAVIDLTSNTATVNR